MWSLDYWKVPDLALNGEAISRQDWWLGIRRLQAGFVYTWSILRAELLQCRVSSDQARDLRVLTPILLETKRSTVPHANVREAREYLSLPLSFQGVRWVPELWMGSRTLPDKYIQGGPGKTHSWA